VKQLFIFMLFFSNISLAEYVFKMIYEEEGKIYSIEDKKSKYCGKEWRGGDVLKNGKITHNFCWMLNEGNISIKKDSFFSKETIQIPYSEFHSIFESQRKRITPIRVDVDGELMMCGQIEGDNVIHCRHDFR